MPMDRTLYPPDWREISTRVKERAHWRCERCDLRHGDYGYRDRHGEWYRVDGYEGLGCEPEEKIVRIVLTGHHIIALAEGGSNSDDNLTALCQRCHNLADSPMRQRHASETRGKKRDAAKVAAGQAALL